MTIYDFINGISSGAFDEQFKLLYGPSRDTLLRQRARYLCAAENFSSLYPERIDIHVFSAPESLEIGGSQVGESGSVLASAVNSDIIALVAFHGEGVVRFMQDSLSAYEITLDTLRSARMDGNGSDNDEIETLLSEFAAQSAEINGFDAYILSDVQEGISSSKDALILLLGKIFGVSDADNADARKIAGVYGGFAFADPINSETRSVLYDFSRSGFSLCVTEIDSSLPSYEFNLSDFCVSDEDEFYEKLPELKEEFTDSELLAAAYFFDENTRVRLETEALENGDTEEFFKLVNDPGEAACLINPENTNASLAVLVSKRFQSGSGAVTVRGGRLIAFVPNYLAGEYTEEMNRIFGKNSCRIMSVRTVGVYELNDK